MRQVAMLNLAAEYAVFADEARETVDAVLESQRFIGGPAVAELEAALSDRIGAAHAIAVSSGTDALLCAMMTLGIGQGDEVIVPSFTFFATAGAVARLGARPVFVDIDPRSFNLDPNAIEPALTERTKAIIVVHLFGQCADMDPINAIAARHRVKVIEDAAQAIGATYRGRYACTLGDVACVSFYPTKNLGGFGEGGMIFTDDEALARFARSLRNHGESQRYVHDHVGGNFRLDTLKAALLLVKLRHFDEFTNRRRLSAARYDELLRDTEVTTPHVPDREAAVYHQYSILCDRRDDLRDFLGERGVGTGVYYPVPLHRQPCFASLIENDRSLPVTEQTCERILSLPCHPMLNDEDLAYVASYIGEFYAASGAAAVAAPASGTLDER